MGDRSIRLDRPHRVVLRVGLMRGELHDGVGGEVHRVADPADRADRAEQNDRDGCCTKGASEREQPRGAREDPRRERIDEALRRLGTAPPQKVFDPLLVARSFQAHVLNTDLRSKTLRGEIRGERIAQPARGRGGGRRRPRSAAARAARRSDAWSGRLRSGARSARGRAARASATAAWTSEPIDRLGEVASGSATCSRRSSGSGSGSPCRSAMQRRAIPISQADGVPFAGS